jgi:broad specificity phosphatase PhoE
MKGRQFETQHLVARMAAVTCRNIEGAKRKPLMQVAFVRHGESTGNIGVFPSDNETLELTMKGVQQAQDLAANWIESPTRIISSSYVRALQTAMPTIHRFGLTPTEIWPIQEFGYARPERWRMATNEQRTKWVEDFWTEANPDYCDGAGAESLRSLLNRARSTLEGLAGYPSTNHIYCFSHGQFIHALRSLILFPSLPPAERMSTFWCIGPSPVQNAEKVYLRICSG